MIHKNTKILLGMILLIGIVTGTLVAINLTKVTYEPEDIYPTKTNVINKISILCGKDWLEVETPETDLDEGDVKDLIVHSRCEETVNEIQDWNDNVWLENKYGTKSFNETFLEEDECSKDGNVFDTNDGTCSEPVEEPPIEEPPIEEGL